MQKHQIPSDFDSHSALKGLVGGLNFHSFVSSKFGKARLKKRMQVFDTAKLVRAAVETIDKDIQHYWIATLYTLLMSEKERKSKAAYFTPPYLCRYLLSAVEHFGADLASAKVLDPAAGGAAFLSSTAVRMKELGCTNEDILKRIRGMEIDAGLADLARSLIADRLQIKKSRKIVKVCDSLFVKPRSSFDLVLVNPPYGRIFKPNKNLLQTFNVVINRTHVNLYVLFMYLSILHLKVGGIGGFIVPLSFIGGPAFAPLRSWLFTNTTILRLDVIKGRTGVFHDVIQDACVLVVRRSADMSHNQRKIESGIVLANGTRQSFGVLQIDENYSMPWKLPALSFSNRNTNSNLDSTLSDYGYTTRTGFFVWNRERHRVRKSNKPLKGIKISFYPLVWAKNIRAGKVITPSAKDNNGIDFVLFKKESSGIVREPCLVLQRTSNTKQSRRLVVGRITSSLIEKWGGVVTENHTIIVETNCEKPRISLSQMCELLGTEEVDREFRRMCGTATISTVALRELRLPNVKLVEDLLSRGYSVEEAVKRSCGAGSAAKL
jgi:adenine-specific DNA-methyltransferase